MTQNPTHTAVLIDAENSAARQIKFIFKQMEASGKITDIIKAGADWTNPHVKNWKQQMKDIPVETLQRFSYGKESTDIIIAVEAMEILYTCPQIQCVCFVSSDGDFEIPARKIKNKGLMVMGVGRMKTRQNFVKLCDEFIYTDDPANPLDFTLPSEIITPELIEHAFEKSIDTAGMAKLSSLGHVLKQLCPGFDIHKSGYTSLSGLIKSFAPKYELLPDGKGGLLVKRIL